MRLWPRTKSQKQADAAEAQVREQRAILERERIDAKRDALTLRRKIAMSVHRAAEQNRFTNDWIAPATSADSAIVADMPRTNARARQLVRDDPWAKSIVRSFRRNVVGTGITPLIDKKPFKRDFEAWMNNPRAIDMERRRSLPMIQQWAMSEVVTVGEAFIVRWVTGDGLQLQCFEYEQLDRYKITERSTGNEVRHGIEVDEHGAPVAFHFYKHHPNDIRGLARPAPITLESMRVPARFVCHIMDPERVRQTHGFSRMGPVIRKIRDLSEYDAAMLRVARAEACIGLLIKGGDDSVDPLELDGLNVAYIDEDESVDTFTPSRPGGQYDPYMQIQIRSIAAGVGTSYGQIARDFTQGNFSGQRVASIEDRREFMQLQQMLITQLCEPIMQDWQFVWAMQNVDRSADYFITGEQPEPVQWQGQGWDWVDPEVQGKAIERKMRLGLTSRTRECNLLGLTPEQLDREMASDGTLEAVARAQGDGRENPSPDKPQPTDITDTQQQPLPEVADAA